MFSSNFFKKSTGGLFVLFFVLLTCVSFNNVKAEDNSNVASGKVINKDDEEIQQLKAEIVELRKKHDELKAQVKSGKMTKEEAQKVWLDLVDQMRAKKDMIIDKRIQNISEKLDSVKERKVEILQALSEFKQERQQLILERKQIKQKFKSGEITKEEMKKMFMENKSKKMQNKVEKRNEIKNAKMKGNNNNNSNTTDNAN